MRRPSLHLDVIDVVRPCSADWNAMRGDERVRFCRHCSLHVYNLSEMPRREAERLVRETEGKLCVRFYRRADGTVTTHDCGIKAAAKRVGRWASATTAVVLAAMLGALGLTRASNASLSDKCSTPVKTPLMGKMAALTSQSAVLMGQAMVLMGTLAPLPVPSIQPATQLVTSE